jgi:hypothetical protein
MPGYIFFSRRCDLTMRKVGYPLPSRLDRALDGLLGRKHREDPDCSVRYTLASSLFSTIILSDNAQPIINKTA